MLEMVFKLGLRNLNVFEQRVVTACLGQGSSMSMYFWGRNKCGMCVRASKKTQLSWDQG